MRASVLLDGLLGAAREGIARALGGDGGGVPVGLDALAAVAGAPNEIGPGRELANALVDRVRGGNIVEPQQQTERAAVDLSVPIGVRLEGGELRAEQEGLPRGAVVERLLAEAIARQDERSLAAVPKPEGEHADRTLEGTAYPPRRYGREQDLRIAVPPPSRRRARALQLGAQLGVIVDFTIERDDPAARVGKHRLMPGRREVDDREPPVGQRRAGVLIDPHAVIVGAAPGNRVRHLARDALPGARACIACDEAGYSAHLTVASRRSRTLLSVPVRRARALRSIPILVGPARRQDRQRFVDRDIDDNRQCGARQCGTGEIAVKRAVEPHSDVRSATLSRYAIELA